MIKGSELEFALKSFPADVKALGHVVLQCPECAVPHHCHSDAGNALPECRLPWDRRETDDGVRQSNCRYVAPAHSSQRLTQRTVFGSKDEVGQKFWHNSFPHRSGCAYSHLLDLRQVKTVLQVNEIERLAEEVHESWRTASSDVSRSSPQKSGNAT